MSLLEKLIKETCGSLQYSAIGHVLIREKVIREAYTGIGVQSALSFWVRVVARATGKWLLGY